MRLLTRQTLISMAAAGLLVPLGAMAAGAAGAGSPTPTGSSGTADPAPCPHASVPPGGQPAAPAVPAPPAAGGPTGLTQTISVSVLPGGPDRVTPVAIDVRPGTTSQLGPFTVVDPRGTLVGWSLWVRAVGPAGPVSVHGAWVTAVSGLQQDVCAPGGTFRADGAFLVADAPAGGGGGTFRAGATVTVPAGASGPVRIVATLRPPAR
ncbi:MAG: hypothetical protein M0Z62_09840 [Actinomycetota bacterium]|nr:hypothetical protein [Actinomycetota bacterium]